MFKSKKKEEVNQFEKEYIVLTTEQVPKVCYNPIGCFDVSSRVISEERLYCYLLSKEEIQEFVKEKGSNCIKHISKNNKCDLKVTIDVED